MATNGKKERKAPRTRAVRAAEAEAEAARAAAKAREEALTGLERDAREQTRRELAVWVMAVRERCEALHESLQAVFLACRDTGSLLYGQIDAERVGYILGDLDAAVGHLAVLTVACRLPDVVATAKGFQDHWCRPFEARRAKAKGGAR